MKRIAHLIGVGGSGMSGAAQVLLERGYTVSGSDQNEGAEIQRLREAGARIYRGHDASHLDAMQSSCGALQLDQQIDDARVGDGAHAAEPPLVVRSLAIPDTNPECRAAIEHGWPVLSYADLIGRWSRERASICVAGTHGKTTTTSMVVAVLKAAGVDPGFVIGGRPRMGNGAGRAAAWGSDGAPFALESCEYGGSFHRLRPRVAAVTNIEADHLDYYIDLDGVCRAFRRFVTGEPDWTAPARVLTAQAAQALSLRVEDTSRWIADGPGAELPLGDADSARIVRAAEVSTRNGTPFFVPVFGERRLPPVHLAVPGRHNVTNALVALAAVLEAGIDPEAGLLGLEQFRGAERRFQILAETADFAIVDDYAHHPTEIQATIEAARERFPARPIIAVFQPHQASRTREHLREFGRVLATVDAVVLPEIYYTRDLEDDRRTVSARLVASEIEARGGRASYAAGLDEALPQALAHHRDGVVYLVMGAGDVFRLAEGLVRELSGRCCS